mgnify:CR=1 FL=1
MVKTEKFILRYANCWEDADLLCAILKEQPTKKICSIASGGENSFSMLTCNPEKLFVIDVNPIQIYLVELKKAAIQQLDYQSCLQFKGFKSCDNRLEIYEYLKPYLSKDAQLFWDKNKTSISKGIIHSGNIEMKMQFFSKYVRPLFHTRKECEELMRTKPQEEQELFYENVWNNLRWRVIFKLFFSRTVMQWMAPDPDFLNYYIGNISDNLLSKLKTHLSSTLTPKNHILNYVLFGHYGNILPHYMQQSNYEIIKNNLHKVILKVGFVQDIGKEGDKIDFFNLSNIFEYTTPAEFLSLSESLYQISSENARLMYWNILVRRKLSEINPTKFNNLLDSSEQFVQDKGLTYERCVVEKIKHLKI